jgi:septal ring factor EnvC (AmiA/AmiB activator)
MAKPLTESIEFEEFDVMSQDYSKEFDVPWNNRDSDDAITLQQGSAINLIQNECNQLKKKLGSLMEKISENREILKRKQLQNDEMKKTIEGFHENIEKALVQNASCSCSKNCLIF